MGDRTIRLRGAVSADNGFNDVSGGVGSTEIANGSISAAKLAADAVETAKIKNKSVTYGKVQDVSATDKVLGRETAGAGVVEEISCTAAGRDLLDDATAGDQRTTLGLGALAVKGTVAAGDIDADAVDKTKIAADVAGAGLAQNVDGSLEVGAGTGIAVGADAVGLAAGYTPTHVAKFAGTITWSGAGASLDTAIEGVLATDVVSCTFRVAPTEAGYLVSAIPSAGHLVITLSAANTSNQAQIDYVIFRAVA